MRVRVDQAGKNGGVGKIDGLRAGSHFRVGSRADAHNLVAFDHDGLAGERVAGFHVEQVAGADHDVTWTGRDLGKRSGSG
jgi:hypothetical protein